MDASRREEVGEQLEEASERLAEVAAELHSWVGPAARHAPNDEEAERLKRQAAAAIHDVARMLGSEGPAAAIAEEIVEEDLSALDESSRAVLHQSDSGGGSAAAHSAAAGGRAQATEPASPKSPRPVHLPVGSVREGNAERTL